MSELATPVFLSIGRHRRKTVALVSIFLGYRSFVIYGAALTAVKVGPVEIDQIYDILAILIYFAQNDFRIEISKNLRPLIRLYWGFFLLVTIGAALAYALKSFYVPLAANTLLRLPGFISIARLVQIMISGSLFLIVVRDGLRSASRLQGFALCFVLIAFISSAYGIVSYVLLKYLHSDVGGAYGNDYDNYIRLRGFFNEGGPFGLFAISALFIFYFIDVRKFVSPLQKFIIGAVILVAIALSGSKSAFLMAGFVFAASSLFLRPAQFAKWLAGIALVSAVSLPLAYSLGLGKELLSYATSYQKVSAGGYADVTDNNVTLGRIAGSIIVPKMIEQNPIFGVGIGNYSLTRDDPHYLGFLPPTDLWDLASLGIYGDIAEIGIPAGLIISCFFAYPALIARSKKLETRYVWLAMLPISCLIFDAQINFTYIWILNGLVSATVLARIRAKRVSQDTPISL